MCSGALRIALAADCWRPTSSGVVTSMLQLRDGLERRGHRAIVLTVATPGDGGSEPGVYRFPSLPFNAASGFRLGLVTPGAVAGVLQQEGIEVVHTHTEWSVGWAARFAARITRLPLVHTAHTFIEAYRHYLPVGEIVPRSLVRAYVRRFLAPYGAVFCPSPRMANYLAAILPNLVSVVIANGLDRAQFATGPVCAHLRAAGRRALGLGPEERLILYAGRIAKEKRVAELLAALIPLLRARPATTFLLVGGGRGRRALEESARKAGLERQVVFAGVQSWERMRELYCAADVFATASLSEVQPMTLIEAAMAGLPVVARRDQATAAVVHDRVSGYLVKSDAEIAARVARLLADEALRLRLSQAALQVAQAFDVESHVDRVEAAYRRLLVSCTVQPAGLTAPATGSRAGTQRE